MRKERRVKVQAETARLGPVQPAGKVLGGELVPIDAFAKSLGVDGMKVHAVGAGNEGEGLVEVGAEFVGVAGFAGIVAGGLDAAAGKARGTLETADIIPLPAMQRNGDVAQCGQGAVGINAGGGVIFTGETVGGFEVGHGNSVAR